jgi:hypothetical protein
MTFVAHTLIGAAIAAKITNPYLAGPIALCSHFLCDMIPHWDLGTSWRNRPKKITGTLAIIETFIAIFGTYFLFINIIKSPILLITVIFFSLLPDWLEAPYFMFANSPKIFKYVYKIQSFLHSRLPAPWGIYTQILVVIIFLFFGFVI